MAYKIDQRLSCPATEVGTAQTGPYHGRNKSAQRQGTGLMLEALRDRLLAMKPTKHPVTYITAEECIAIAEQASAVFSNEPMLLFIEPPMSILGDTHGQFFDLQRVLNTGGRPPHTRLLFLGDYVDRGKNSIEVVMLLFVYKLLHPSEIHLLRGNHEEARVNSTYGFLSECINRFSFEVYAAFNNCFNNMPIAAVVATRIFCCHGGIVKDLYSLSEIAELPRPQKAPNENTIMGQLTWSDPNREADGWIPSARGVGYQFGKTPLWEFLERFNFDLLARAHEVVQDGYEFFAHRRCVTIFSAPKYCDQFDNAAAIMRVAEDLTCSFVIIRPPTAEHPKIRVEYHGQGGTCDSTAGQAGGPTPESTPGSAPTPRTPQHAIKKRPRRVMKRMACCAIA
ncbi:serine/threonine-protein phosphatase PP1-beta-like [Tropilaelaps mercedesae]|uniref:Serine/threonine-protein phosphatase n=1 Tax=Tropilaelaps mercedesae TaxID=418985 RepID=A0A1V9XT76_9ACAR|nr:serine/threonine-protein phosphatase PP1-beta-like [Tropilaelaps mercedesae]